ncbi:hypothetical protein HDZ31DRAFT_78946, partial [Schizophyllum fasciatum]
GRDPIAVWSAFEGDENVRELALFAKLIFTVVVNTAGCERTFSHLKIIQTPHRARLTNDKLEAMTKIASKIRSENIERGVIKPRGGRKNHKNVDMLMSVPRYRDLLEDQEYEDTSERGRLLVSSAEGWRVEMAKWVADARAAEKEELDESLGRADDDSDTEFPEQVDAPRLAADQRRAADSAGPKVPIKILFSGLPPIKRVRLIVTTPQPAHITQEQGLMKALAEEVLGGCAADTDRSMDGDEDGSEFDDFQVSE